jgi:hypothetical protein
MQNSIARKSLGLLACTHRRKADCNTQHYTVSAHLCSPFSSMPWQHESSKNSDTDSGVRQVLAFWSGAGGAAWWWRALAGWPRRYLILNHWLPSWWGSQIYNLGVDWCASLSVACSGIRLPKANQLPHPSREYHYLEADLQEHPELMFWHMS